MFFVAGNFIITYYGCCVVTGILKGYDQLLNLVLDGTTEYLCGN